MKAEEYKKVVEFLKSIRVSEHAVVHNHRGAEYDLCIILKKYADKVANQRVIEELEDIRESMGQTYPEYHTEIVEERIKELKQE